MKENLLISIMLRNNQIYIPYFFKCIDLVEKTNTQYNINYLVYTNNNTDNTINLLKNNAKKNMKIIEENYSKEFLDKPRVIKLHYLREDFLNIIRKEDFDYLLMLDSDIMFNGKMIFDGLEILKSNNYNAVTSNTITYSSCFYYDIFSLSTKDKRTHDVNILTNRSLRKFYYKSMIENHIDVDSAFGGFFLTSSKIIHDKNLSYIKGNKNIENNTCEHKYFNSKIKNIKFISNITPFWEYTMDEKTLKNCYNIIKNNKSDNRKLRRLFTTGIGFYIILGILILINIKNIIKFRKIIIYTSIILLICYVIYEVTKHDYRLGDVIFNKKINNIFNRTLYKTKWRNSIASEYYSKCTKYEDYDTLYNIVKLKTKKEIIPDTKSLVIHLRTGDTNIQVV